MIGTRWMMAGLVAATCVACTGDDATSDDDARATDGDITAAVLQVRVDDCGPREIVGTASLIDTRYALTAAHVVAGSDSVRVIDPTGTVHDAFVVLFDPDLDVALLRTPPDLGTPLTFVDDDIATGTTGHVAFARDVDGTLDPETATVEVLRHVNIETTDIYLDRDVTRTGFEISATVGPGDSGAVVVIDGGAAGVIWARSTRSEGRAWTVDIPEVVRDPARRRALTDEVGTGPCT